MSRNNGREESNKSLTNLFSLPVCPICHHFLFFFPFFFGLHFKPIMSLSPLFLASTIKPRYTGPCKSEATGQMLVPCMYRVEYEVEFDCEVLYRDAPHPCRSIKSGVNTEITEKYSTPYHYAPICQPCGQTLYPENPGRYHLLPHTAQPASCNLQSVVLLYSTATCSTQMVHLAQLA